MSKETMWSELVAHLKSEGWDVNRTDARPTVFEVSQDGRSKYVYRLYSRYHAKGDYFFYSPDKELLEGCIQDEGGVMFLMEGTGVVLVPFKQLNDLLDEGNRRKAQTTVVVNMHLKASRGQLSLLASGTGEWRGLSDCTILQPAGFSFGL